MEKDKIIIFANDTDNNTSESTNINEIYWISFNGMRFYFQKAYHSKCHEIS